MRASKKINCIYLHCILYIVLCTSLCYSQGTWTQKANVFTTPRAGAVGFSIGNKGYMGTGWQFGGAGYYNDFWEWDQSSNAWTQKANFAGTSRGDAVGFAIGNKGYILTGITASSIATNELWEWNQPMNTWSQKAIFPGAARFQAASFSIGLKGYIGFGAGALSDFWEYDQVTDTWTQKANIPVSREASVSFSIGNKGYICTGVGSNSVYLNDTWEFDPVLNSWTQKAMFPGGIRAYAAGFAIGNVGYIGTGYGLAVSHSDLWRFNPLTNQWTQMADYPHPVSDIDHAAFSIECKGYFGTGATNPAASPYYNDFWEYEPDTCSLTGINEPGVESSELEAFPNPFSEKLNVSINSHELSEIILYDMSSKKVVHKNFTHAVSIDTKSFAKGIYIYEVRNKNGILKREKIVKN